MLQCVLLRMQWFDLHFFVRSKEMQAGNEYASDYPTLQARGACIRDPYVSVMHANFYACYSSVGNR